MTSGSFSVPIFIGIAGIRALFAFGLHAAGHPYSAFFVLGVAVFVAALFSSAVQAADQWSKAVVLRPGEFRSLQGHNLFFIIPLFDILPCWIDTRVPTSSFVPSSAIKTMQLGRLAGLTGLTMGRPSQTSNNQPATDLPPETAAANSAAPALLFRLLPHQLTFARPRNSSCPSSRKPLFPQRKSCCPLISLRPLKPL